ncbi:MAG: DUF1080 domain-containing protein [Candidatus Anammoximicrobium sp.]|nr:DUF1080 domain-containing protein [Candidatus Anammoximicrobium sp.]
MIRPFTTTAAVLFAIGLLAASAQAADQGWIRLFDGQDLSAWDNGSGGAPGAGWVVQDGTLIRQKPAGYIWSKQSFGDFVLELEFKTEGNSGVFFRTGNPRDCVQTGLEMQVDKPAAKPNKHTVGALYDALAPTKNAALNDWNKVVITCRGSRVTIEMNREQIVVADLDQWNQAGKNPDGTPNKYRTALKDFPREGKIGLQEHGAVVAYRNIRVKPLK